MNPLDLRKGRCDGDPTQVIRLREPISFPESANPPPGGRDGQIGGLAPGGLPPVACGRLRQNGVSGTAPPMDFRKRAKLDPTQVEDRRGMRGGRGMAVGGGAGVVGVIVVLLVTLLGGGNIDPSALESLEGVIVGGQQQQGEVIDERRTGEAPSRAATAG